MTIPEILQRSEILPVRTKTSDTVRSFNENTTQLKIEGQTLGDMGIFAAWPSYHPFLTFAFNEINSFRVQGPISWRSVYFAKMGTQPHTYRYELYDSFKKGAETTNDMVYEMLNTFAYARVLRDGWDMFSTISGTASYKIVPRASAPRGKRVFIVHACGGGGGGGTGSVLLSKGQGGGSGASGCFILHLPEDEQNLAFRFNLPLAGKEVHNKRGENGGDFRLELYDTVSNQVYGSITLGGGYGGRAWNGTNLSFAEGGRGGAVTISAANEALFNKCVYVLASSDGNSVEQAVQGGAQAGATLPILSYVDPTYSAAEIQTRTPEACGYGGNGGDNGTNHDGSDGGPGYFTIYY